MEKSELAIAHSNKAKLKAYGYGSALIGLLVVGLIISNMVMFGYMFKQFDQVRSYNITLILAKVSSLSFRLI